MTDPRRSAELGQEYLLNERMFVRTVREKPHLNVQYDKTVRVHDRRIGANVKARENDMAQPKDRRVFIVCTLELHSVKR